MEALPSNVYIDETLYSFLEHPWFFLLRLVITICLITRGVTSIRSRLQPAQADKAGIYTIPRVPYWIPFIGHQLLFSLRYQTWFLNLSRSYKPEIFAITLLSNNYHVIASSDLTTALQQPGTPVTGARYQQLQSRRFFANGFADERTATRIATATNVYAKDKSKSEYLCKVLEANTYNLISPSRSRIDQAQWERNADVQVLSPVSAKPSELCVSASLPALIREFASYTILATLLGSSFLESNPSFVDDLFAFGSKYDSFMTGWPYWIVPGLGPPAWAREKCLMALEGLADAVVADMQNESGGGLSVLYNVDEVHRSLHDLIRQAWRDNDQAPNTAKKSRRAMLRIVACEMLEIAWLTTYDASNMVLWAILDIFKEGHEDLTSRVQKEIMDIIHVEKGKPTGLPIGDPPKLHFKIKGRSYSHDIQTTAPDASGVLLVNERLRTWQGEYLDVFEDFVLRAINGKTSRESSAMGQQHDTEGRAFQLRKGDRLYIAHGVSNREPRQLEAADTFDVMEKVSKKQTEMPSRIGSSDKRGFFGQVEQIHYIVAAIVSMYRFEEIDGGPLSVPSSSLVAGMFIPSNSFRAKILRRHS